MLWYRKEVKVGGRCSLQKSNRRWLSENTWEVNWWEGRSKQMVSTDWEVGKMKIEPPQQNYRDCFNRQKYCRVHSSLVSASCQPFVTPSVFVCMSVSSMVSLLFSFPGLARFLTFWKNQEEDRSLCSEMIVLTEEMNNFFFFFSLVLSF